MARCGPPWPATSIPVSRRSHIRERLATGSGSKGAPTGRSADGGGAHGILASRFEFPLACNFAMFLALFAAWLLHNILSLPVWPCC